MKKKFIFDKSENDILDIDESTVIKETGIDAAKVKESIMKEIRNEKKSKKMSVQKVFSIVAVAAAITAAATVTAMAATGAFNPAFGEMFAGQPANGIFPGSDISVKSDALDIEFVGVTGDETEMFSIYNITKKDGSDFVDNADNYIFLGTNADMNVSESLFKQMKTVLDGGQGKSSGVSYKFADTKTIRAFVSYCDSVGCIKGERLTVKDTEANFYHIDEVLYSDSSDTFLGCSAFMEDNEELINEKQASFKENQFIIPIHDNGLSKLVAVTQTTVPFEYELGVKLNYKTAERTFSDVNGKTFNALNTDWTVTQLKAGSFGINIEAETNNCHVYDGFDMENQDNWSDETLHDYFNVSTDIEIKITLADGTVIKTMTNSSTSRSEVNGCSHYSWDTSYYRDGDSAALYALDANNIVSIEINGTKLVG